MPKAGAPDHPAARYTDWVESPNPSAPSLNRRRDVYTGHMRDLMDRVSRVMPAGVDGILGRVEGILAAQRGGLDALDAVDLESVDGIRESALLLLRAEQLPRMILSVGEVLVQEEKDMVLRPLQRRCLELAHQLADFRAEWFLLHQDKIELFDDEVL